jgi:hypothetical protein
MSHLCVIRKTVDASETDQLVFLLLLLFRFDLDLDLDDHSDTRMLL